MILNDQWVLGSRCDLIVSNLDAIDFIRHIDKTYFTFNVYCAYVTYSVFKCFLYYHLCWSVDTIRKHQQAGELMPFISIYTSGFHGLDLTWTCGHHAVSLQFKSVSSSSVSGKDGRLAVMCTHLTFPHSRYDERSREAEQDMATMIRSSSGW